MSKLTNYLKDTKAEMSHVTWPKRRIVIMYTVAVIVISVILAYFLGLFDFIFSLGLKTLIGA